MPVSIRLPNNYRELLICDWTDDIWYSLQEAGIAVWVVRGFGTAIMHGGASAIMAILTVAIHESRGHNFLLASPPGSLIATLVHSIFNHLLLSPVLSALLVVVCLHCNHFWM